MRAYLKKRSIAISDKGNPFATVTKHGERWVEITATNAVTDEQGACSIFFRRPMHCGCDESIVAPYKFANKGHIVMHKLTRL